MLPKHVVVVVIAELSKNMDGILQIIKHQNQYGTLDMYQNQLKNILKQVIIFLFGHIKLLIPLEGKDI